MATFNTQHAPGDLVWMVYGRHTCGFPMWRYEAHLMPVLSVTVGTRLPDGNAGDPTAVYYSSRAPATVLLPESAVFPDTPEGRASAEALADKMSQEQESKERAWMAAPHRNWARD